MKILITGGTGSLGQALISFWHGKHELKILSRNPHKQQMVQAKFGLNPSAFVLVDICDYEAVRAACIGQDILIHAAALKIVSQGEQYPVEYHRVNAIGSQVVARAWADTHYTRPPDNGPMPKLPRKAIYINSDKAVAPINHYGATKKIGEDFFISRGFSSIRYGNVVESDGSFIHKWVELAEKGRPIPVRFPHPTRYFLSMIDAIGSIEDSLSAIDLVGNGIFVPNDLSAFDIYQVAQAFTHPHNICERELEPGEKRHESIIAPGEIIENTGLDGLSRVCPGWSSDPGKYPPALTSSEYAPHLKGDEVLRHLGVSPRQEVFA